MPKEENTVRSGKMELADLEAKVERLELDAREYEARVRVIEGKARLEQLKAEYGRSGKKKTEQASA